jgi:nucleotide-binding universal stress UspA family protein
MTHFLVPMDGSPLAEGALEHVLAEHPDDRITVLHVIDPMEAVYMAEAGGPTFAEEWVESAREEGEAIAEAARAAAADRGTDLTAITEVGKPARVILDVIEREGVDHVVMGSHGRRGIPRVVLGSVAEAVMRRSRVPVTIVR